MKVRKSVSIKKILYVIITFTILIQFVISLVSVFAFRTTYKINSKYFDYLEMDLVNNSNIISNELNTNVSEMAKISEYYSDLLSNELYKRDINFNELKHYPQYIDEILMTTPFRMKHLITNSDVSGAFILLDTGVKADTNNSLKPGVYLRTSGNKQENRYILQYGPSGIAVNNNVALADDWNSEFDFSSNNITDKDFYAVPLSSIKNSANNDNLMKYGYWSKPYRISADSESKITFTLPIINKSGEFYGIVGVEFSKEYIISLLKPSQINDDKNTYLITTESAVKNHDSSDAIIKSNSNFTFEDINKIKVKGSNEDVYLFTTQNKNYYAFYKPIDMYKYNNSSNVKFVLAVIFPCNVVDNFSLTILSIIVSSLLIALIITLFIGLYLCTFIIKPITLMNRSIQTSNEETYTLNTGINEIDILISTLEEKNRDVIESSLHMSKIIDLLDFSIATFEYVKGSDKVYVTNSFIKLLNVNPTLLNDYCVLKKDWDMIMVDVCSQDNMSYNGTYHLDKDTDCEKWISIKTYDTQDRTVGVITDVTDEIKERIALEHDRDYDLMTGLLNKRAFVTLIDQKFSSAEFSESHVCAMAMWHLDGLKYINDNFGRTIGDRYIVEVSKILNSSFIGSEKIIARLNGDEFIVFLANMQTEEEYKQLVTDSLNKLCKIYIKLPSGEKVSLSATVGISYSPEDAVTCKELLRCCDFAIYRTSNVTRNSISVYDSEKVNIINEAEVIIVSSED